MLLTGLGSEKLSVKCPGGHPHDRIEGGLTKHSAVYTGGLHGTLLLQWLFGQRRTMQVLRGGGIRRLRTLLSMMF